MHFFTNDGGGNMMLFINLIWAWGHPEVYILILPAFGIFSEVIATFSGKPLFGYRSMVLATLAICVLSFTVWLHHFFTMGAGANVNAFFGIMSMIIAIPTGVKVFNWLFTLYQGRARFEVPVLWSIGFMVTFVIGGLTGVLMAVPPADFVLHNSVFLVAHFHNVIIGGVLFGAMAGYTYWFPKAFGFTLDRRLGAVSFWCWQIGFYLAFMPLYILGLLGMTRRMQHYADTSWQPYLIVAEVGAIVILCGIAATIAQLIVSIRSRESRRDLTGDPWNGRTLEWSTASPPPVYNFAVLPQVHSIDAFWVMKHRTTEVAPRSFDPIEIPKNSPNGFVTALFAVITGFALIWHIWWMAMLGVTCALLTLLIFGWMEPGAIVVSAEQIALAERSRMRGIPRERYKMDVGRHAAGQQCSTAQPISARGPGSVPESRWPTDFGYFCSPTSSCFLRYLQPTRCCPGKPPADLQVASSSSCGMWALETVCLRCSRAIPADLVPWPLSGGIWRGFYLGFTLTFVLGATFLGLELSEFISMAARGASAHRAARSFPHFSPW